MNSQKDILNPGSRMHESRKIKAQMSVILLFVFLLSVVAKSAASAGVGYGASNLCLSINGFNIGSSPLLKSVIVSPLAAGAGHVAGGTTANLFAGQNLEDAFLNSFDGIGKSMAIGGAIGVSSTLGTCFATKTNPINGKYWNWKFNSTGKHSVYQGFDAAEDVRYVGITERDPSVRFDEHLNSNSQKSSLNFESIDGANGLSKTEARILEQTIINQYGLGKNGGQLYNKINSIDPRYWKQNGIKPYKY